MVQSLAVRAKLRCVRQITYQCSQQDFESGITGRVTVGRDLFHRHPEGDESRFHLNADNVVQNDGSSVLSVVEGNFSGCLHSGAFGGDTGIIAAEGDCHGAALVGDAADTECVQVAGHLRTENQCEPASVQGGTVRQSRKECRGSLVGMFNLRQR